MSLDIIILTKNRPRKFINALRSIDSQTTLESVNSIIVMDHDSTLWSTLSNFFSCLFRRKVKYKRVSSKLSLGLVRNEALKLSKADYCTFLDDDDLLHRNFCEYIDYQMTKVSPDIILVPVPTEFKFSGILDPRSDYTYYTNTLDVMPSSYDSYPQDKFSKFYACNGGKIFKRESYNRLNFLCWFRESTWDDTVPISSLLYESNSISFINSTLYLSQPSSGSNSAIKDYDYHFQLISRSFMTLLSLYPKKIVETYITFLLRVSHIRSLLKRDCSNWDERLGRAMEGRLNWVIEVLVYTPDIPNDLHRQLLELSNWYSESLEESHPLYKLK